MKRKITGVITASSALLPLLALGQSGPNLESGYFGNLLTQIGSLLDKAVPIIIALALIWFLWNLFMYIFRQEDKKKAAAGMLWGIVILAVMVSVWGLVRLAQNLAGVDQTETSAPPVPELPDKVPGV